MYRACFRLFFLIDNFYKHLSRSWIPITEKRATTSTIITKKTTCDGGIIIIVVFVIQTTAQNIFKYKNDDNDSIKCENDTR